MTKPELFGLPKWLTETEEELLAGSYRETFDALIQASDFSIATKSVVNEDVVSVRVQATDTSLLFGLARPHYVYRQTFDHFLNIKDGDEPKPPYLLFTGDAPYDVADILGELFETYGLRLGFEDVIYSFGDRLPNEWPSKLIIDPASLRYKTGKIPMYAAPADQKPLVRMVNPGRYVEGFKELFQDVEIASPSEFQYFGVNATQAIDYIETLTNGMTFEEAMDTWDFGNQYLIPRWPDGPGGWVSSPIAQFQNVYNAKVVYNGKLRVQDTVPINNKLTHNLVIRLDPRYSLRATGLIRIYYRIPDRDIPLSSILLVTVLNGLNYVPPGEDIPLSSILRRTQLSGLTYTP